MSEINILIVDDHLVVRKGLIHVLDRAEGLNIIGEAESGEEAIYLAKKLNPDVIIMDIEMEGISGLEATKLISRHQPSICIIALSTFANYEVIERMLQAGAKGYLMKDLGASELISSIKRIYGGEKITPIKLKQDFAGFADFHHNKPHQIAIEKMGDQQKKVLTLMSKGLTNPEIAEHLGISVPTARYHVSAILQKLDVSNRAEAVAIVAKMNINMIG